MRWYVLILLNEVLYPNIIKWGVDILILLNEVLYPNIIKWGVIS